MLALFYQLTPSSIPIAFATERLFREGNRATGLRIDAVGPPLTLNTFLDLCFFAAFRNSRHDDQNVVIEA